MFLFKVRLSVFEELSHVARILQYNSTIVNEATEIIICHGYDVINTDN